MATGTISKAQRVYPADRTPGSTLDQFIDAVQMAIEHRAIDRGTEADDLEQLRDAAPLARSLVLFGDPLDASSEAIGRYVRALQAKIDLLPVDPTDPGHECQKGGAAESAFYFIGLAAGLLLADQFRGAQ